MQLVASPAGTAAVVLRMVLPVEPTPEREIGPPVTSLHLDMVPPPEPRHGRAAGGRSAAVARRTIVPIEERTWTTVRRRELIGRQTGAPDDPGDGRQRRRSGGGADVAIAVASGAMLTCSFGAAPGTLTVLPAGRVNADGVPMANIMDHKPNVNIAPFGMCTSLANPQVSAATSAAQGVLTPAAMRADDPVALGARFTDGDGRRSAGAQQLVDVQLHVGRRDHDQQPRRQDDQCVRCQMTPVRIAKATACERLRRCSRLVTSWMTFLIVRSEYASVSAMSAVS